MPVEIKININTYSNNSDLTHCIPYYVQMPTIIIMCVLRIDDYGII